MNRSLDYKSIKRKTIASSVIVVSIVLFGFYSVVYSSVYRENVKFGQNTPKAKISAPDNSDTAVLGQRITPKVTREPIKNLKLKSAAQVKSVQSRKVLFGVSINDYSNKSGELSATAELIGKEPSTVSIFKHFGIPGNRNLVQSDLAAIKSRGAKLQIAWEPWNPSEGMRQSKDYLKDIGNGTEDEYIKSFANSVSEYQGTVIIRFGHEMNGNWYPWGNRPDEYVKAYQRIVTVFRNIGVSNVSWMWCINAENLPLSPIQNARKFYPGNDYVDIVGIDGVNFGTSQPGSKWRTFDQIFSSSYQFALGFGKPIVIAETASSEIGGNKAQWIREMMESLNSKFTGVNEVIWFNINKETDWRINSSDQSTQALRQSL